MRVIAVSVDPAGDTVPVVGGSSPPTGWGASSTTSSATARPSRATWADWHVAAQAPQDDPEAIEHSSLIYGVTASGELATAYPVGFEAESIARDLPLLARS